MLYWIRNGNIFRKLKIRKIRRIFAYDIRESKLKFLLNFVKTFSIYLLDLLICLFNTWGSVLNLFEIREHFWLYEKFAEHQN